MYQWKNGTFEKNKLRDIVPRKEKIPEDQKNMTKKERERENKLN